MPLLQTSDPVINTEKDELLFLKLDKTLKESGIGKIFIFANLRLNIL